MSKMVRLSFSLTRSQDGELRRLARQRKTTQSAIIREVIDSIIAQYETPASRKRNMR